MALPAVKMRPAPSLNASATRSWSRPSYVLGGRAMEVVFGADELDRYMREAVQVDPDHRC